jgi:hypothetical protein
MCEWIAIMIDLKKRLAAVLASPEASRTPAPKCPAVCLTVKPVGEPDAGNRHVRVEGKTLIEKGDEFSIEELQTAFAQVLAEVDGDRRVVIEAAFKALLARRIN